MISYTRIIDSISHVKLLDEVKQFYPLKTNGFTTNKWIGIYDEPENTVEKYIQDSFDFYLAPQYPRAVGFEWCIYSLEINQTIPLHCDHDEYLRITNNEMRYPLLSTITHLTNDTNPDIIFNTRHGKYVQEVDQFPPSEAYFSIPEEGKFVTFDPRYIRGVYNGARYDNRRITLCYSVWDYRPERLDRIEIISKPFDCRFYKKPATKPLTWLGGTKNLNTNLYDKRFTFKYPDKYTEGETWKVIQ